MAIEKMSPIRHEYYNGEIFAMAGASLNHNRVATDLAAALAAALRGRPVEAFAAAPTAG